MIGFATAAPVAVSHRGRGALVCRRQRPQIVMRAEGAKKKTADLVFAQDMKGRPVWSLREAKVEDVPALCAIGGELERLGKAMLETIVSAGEPGCIVCEANVKGTKAGEGFRGMVLGGVIADVTMAVRDPEQGFSSGVMKRAELLATGVSPNMPEPQDVKKTVILGSMKKLKAAGIDQITRVVAESNTAEKELYESVGFTASQAAAEVRGSKTKQVKLSVTMASINPDPKKRFS